jgi:hypothetical protein
LSQKREPELGLDIIILLLFHHFSFQCLLICGIFYASETSQGIERVLGVQV